MAFSVTLENGTNVSGRDKLAVVAQLMNRAEMDFDSAFKLVSASKTSKGRSEIASFKADLALIKRGVTALLMSARSVSSIKIAKQDEYMRKALAGLDELNEGVFAGLSRKQKYSALLKGCEAFGMSVASDIKALELKI